MNISLGARGIGAASVPRQHYSVKRKRSSVRSQINCVHQSVTKVRRVEINNQIKNQRDTDYNYKFTGNYNNIIDSLICFPWNIYMKPKNI